MLHMVRELLPHVPVLFLETGYHFPETIAYRDRMAAEWNLNLVDVEPERPSPSRKPSSASSIRLLPTAAAALRKVEPLFRSLAPYSIWVTGLRREQSKSRANLQTEEIFTLPSGQTLAKLSPLAEWTTRDVWYYAEAARHSAAAALRAGIHKHRLRTMYEPALRPQ